jgi:hypothetical protein
LVDVKIESASHAEQNVFGMLIGRDTRITKCSGQDRVELSSEHAERALGKCYSLVQEFISAPVEVNKLESEVLGGLYMFENAYGFVNDFGSDAVAGNDCDTFHESVRYALAKELVQVLEKKSSSSSLQMSDMFIDSKCVGLALQRSAMCPER